MTVVTGPSAPRPGGPGDLAVVLPAGEVARTLGRWHADVLEAREGVQPRRMREHLELHAELLDGLVLYPPERAHATVLDLPSGVDPDTYAWALTREVWEVGLVEARTNGARLSGDVVDIEIERHARLTDIATAARRALATVRDVPARPVSDGWRPYLPVGQATDPSATASLLDDIVSAVYRITYEWSWHISEVRLVRRGHGGDLEVLHRVPLGPTTWNCHRTEMSVAYRCSQLAELVTTQGLGLADPLDGWEAQIELHSGQPAPFTGLMDIAYALATLAHTFDRANTRGEPTPLRTGQIPLPAVCLAALAMYVAGVEEPSRSLWGISLLRAIDLLEDDAQARVVATLDPGSVTSTRGRLRTADRTALITAAADDPDTWRTWRRTAIHLLHVPIAEGISTAAGGALDCVIANGAPPWGWYECHDIDPYLHLNLDT